MLDYRMHYGVPGKDELAYFATLPTLAETIREASLARDAGGKRLPHQRRIPRTVLEECAHQLGRALQAIEAAPDFETLHQILRQNLAGIHGVGELTIYDTALRIGARLNLQPSRIFLHAGTRIGARRLGLDANVESLPLEALPQALRSLTPREAEDVLCIYKDRFASQRSGA